MRLIVLALASAAVLSGPLSIGYALSPDYRLETALSSEAAPNSFIIVQDEGLLPAFEHVELGLSSGS